MTTTTRTPRAARAQAPRESAAPRARVKAAAWDSGAAFSVLLLLAIGLIALFSASYSTGYYLHGSLTFFISKQAMFAVAGVAAMVFVSKINYTLYKRCYKIVLLVTIVLLILVAIPGIGTKTGGARRWLFGFQPSELAKLAVIVCFALWMERDPDSVRSLKRIARPYGALLLGLAVLLLLEPHTSATIIILGVGILMLIIGGMNMGFMVPIGVAGAILGTVFYMRLEHVRERIHIWLDPFSDMQNTGYQGSMSQIAIGSGGTFGSGLGQGRQKHLYLPEPQNDFIFSSWCEEMGLIGAVIVIILFGYLIYRGFTIARYAPDRFSCLVATGITAKLAIQTLMNLFVVTGIIPVTGASLPFFSYGGTALLMQLGEMGILLNISRYMRVDARQTD